MRHWILVAAAALLVPAPLAAPLAHPGHEHGSTNSGVEKQSIRLPASNSRTALLSLWVTRAETPRGVVIFGHGMGSNPDAYLGFVERLVDHGYTVVAPLAVDSLKHPDRASFDAPKGFAARVEDLMIARGFAHQAFAGQKVALAGHSYGALLAMIGGGAKSPAGPLKGPPVAAVLALSSPGRIKALVADDAYAGLSAPLMLVTGTADTVPGFVTDWNDHRFAFDTAPAGRNELVVVPGGDHDVALKGAGPVREAIVKRALDFLDAHVAGDAAAAARLAAPAKDAVFTVERR